MMVLYNYFRSYFT